MTATQTRGAADAGVRSAKHLRRFAAFSLFAALYTFALVVFGGFVRITDSGMGCGDDWPKCNGRWIPEFTFPTLIEYTHRLLGVSIGLVLFGVLVYAFVGRREPGVLDSPRRYRYLLDGMPNTKAAGPVIVLQQHQPTAITVVNRTSEPTAVHWHGIELESFNDGVAGFGGYGGRITPLIAAGDSFVARMTPPRAGTFIYHTHVDELRQMGGGLYGTLLVVPPGGRYDESNERVILLGSASDTAGILFNGEYQPDMQLEAGKTYKLRFVHIMIARPAMFALLVGPDGKPDQWTLVAKDGADLPAHQRKPANARQPMSNGETYDFLFTPRAPGTWRLETRAANGNLFGHMTITAR